MLINLESKNSYRFKISQPNFKSKNISAVLASSKDLVEIQPLSTLKSNIWSKFLTMLKPISEGEVLAMVKRLSNYPSNEVLMVMNCLSAYSNMSMLTRLRSELQFKDVRSIETFIEDYDCGNMFNSGIPKSKYLNINHALSYFYNDNFCCVPKCPLENGMYRAIVLDKPTVDYLEELKKSNPKKFKEFLDENSYKMIYLNNFEEGYNVFNQAESFESLVKDKLEKLQNLKNDNPKASVDKLFDELMNGDLLKRINDLEIEPIIIDFSRKTKLSTANIAERLSPIMPSYSKFSEVIDKICELDKKKLSVNEVENLQNFIDERLYVISPRLLCQKLKQLKTLIEEDVKNKGKDVDKIFYNVAKPEKSFALINYLFQKINNIPKDKIFYWENSMSSFPGKNTAYKNMSKELPNGSTVVILDDAFVSGESIVQTQFRYVPNRDVDSFDIIFASVYSTERAKSLIESIPYKTNDDRIISVDSSIEKEYPIKGSTTLILLPHNAPDNNYYAFRPLSELFYPDKRFVQDPWIE